MHVFDIQPFDVPSYDAGQSTTITAVPQFKWRVGLYHSSGGLKKDIFIGQDDTLIKKIKFELNKKICGAGSIEFSYLDFPIDADDYLILSYNNKIVYRAIVDQSIDLKGGKAKLLPYSQRFNELLIGNNFSNQTIFQMLNTIITELQSDSSVAWLDGFVDTGETTTYSKDYSGYKTAKQVIDELVKELDDREWGITADNIFKVYQPSQTTDEILLYGDNPYYTDIKRDIDYKKIKATRYQVFKKEAFDEGQVIRIGQVGYGDPDNPGVLKDYDPLDIEKLTRKKEKKFTVDELITSDEAALDFAYANLIAKAITPEKISLKNFRQDLLFPEIGKKYKVQDRTEYIRRQIINCEALTEDDNTFEKETGRWINATIDNDDYTTGSGSVKLTATKKNEFMQYDFGKNVLFLDPIKISFMLKSDKAGDFLSFELIKPPLKGAWSSGTWSDGPWSNKTEGNDPIYTSEIGIPTSQTWEFYEFFIPSGEFQYIKLFFNSHPSEETTIKVDNIGLFLPHREEYESNVVQASFTIDKEGTDCDVKLNDYDLLANDDLFILEGELDKLKAISQNNT